MSRNRELSFLAILLAMLVVGSIVFVSVGGIALALSIVDLHCDGDGTHCRVMIFEPVVVEPSATPPPIPAEFASLPLVTTTKCPAVNLRKGAYVLFDTPPGRPVDPDSNPFYTWGSEVGKVDICAGVTLFEVTWSPWIGEHWAYVTDGDVRGWLSLDLVERPYHVE